MIQLSVGLELLALLELLDRVLGPRAPAAVGPTGLEAVLVERLLNLPDLAPRQVLRRDRLIVLRSLLIVVRLVGLVLRILLGALILLFAYHMYERTTRSAAISPARTAMHLVLAHSGLNT